MVGRTILRTLAVAGCGALAGAGVNGLAETPARAWTGAEAVAIRCHFSGPLGAADSDILCNAMVDQARAMTVMAVRFAPDDGSLAETDLVLDLSITSETARPDAVTLRVSGRRIGLARTQTPRTQPLHVPLRWDPQGPSITEPPRALAMFLGSPVAGRDNPFDWDRGRNTGS